MSDLLSVIDDLVRQFAYEGDKDGLPAYTTGGLSALESGFAALGWDDPHPAPECVCQYPGCHEWASCGTRTLDGYKTVCFDHFQFYTQEEP